MADDEQHVVVKFPEKKPKELPPETIEDIYREVMTGYPARLARYDKIHEGEDFTYRQIQDISDKMSHSARILIKNTPEAEEFVSQYKPKMRGDAGVDVYITQDRLLMPGQYEDIPSGISICMPVDFYAEVRARSSTSRKQIHVYPGIIDPGYTGEIFVCVQNMGIQPIEAKRGDRFAQLIFHKRVEPEFVNVGDKELPTTERGTKGFGSTNIDKPNPTC